MKSNIIIDIIVVASHIKRNPRMMHGNINKEIARTVPRTWGRMRISLELRNNNTTGTAKPTKPSNGLSIARQKMTKANRHPRTNVVTPPGISSKKCPLFITKSFKKVFSAAIIQKKYEIKKTEEKIPGFFF